MNVFKDIRFWCVLITIAVLVTILVLILSYDKPIDYEVYTVKSGDTLWAIAEKSNGFGRIDRKEIIAEIEIRSGVTAIIYPGDTVFIPVYEEEK